MTDVVGFPLEETDKIMDALELAEQKGDLEALKWCARRLRWLYDPAEVSESDGYCHAEALFNTSWMDALKHDPPPALIAVIISPGAAGRPSGRHTAVI